MGRSTGRPYAVQCQDSDVIMSSKIWYALSTVHGDWIFLRLSQAASSERVGYPTQKPLALLDRIIKASSNEGDFVLDPFAGCATACVSAEALHVASG